ncbi:uncharacterized protein BT62DRAFT_932963 [Guyanagaster necrorhizus]|uniref:Rad60/SUMO-like domain-containing protein n=1 Tax=Guyanagaster necrorhizus TaxID=856835 RepID=A0A9P7VTI1_9AGAR|nr:uncharacterized protein BT62DRAFT_932963 [Guyanagaster necrorhizus MCA 3950]KAG7445799.1 hypothetical protein BT62DRAFT_932963 [Guyanagaster necrorhizus MCA 3950]
MSRPRPRPIIKHKNAEPTSSTSSIPKLSELVVKDSDEMFMRNRSRDMNTWRKLEQKNKEKRPRSRSPDSDRDEDASPQRRKQKKKANNDAVPRWQRDKNLLRLLSEDASDGDDSALQSIETTPGKLKRKRENRQRSRSRSITPPPAIPIQQLQNARNVIRQALAPVPRPASPGLFDDDLDASADPILDPELASIARRSKASFSASQITSEGSGASAILEISVRWQPHPENQGGSSNVQVFKMNRNETFRELFEAIAESQSLLTNNLVMTYQNRRFFPSVTPNTLRIWSSAEFVACNKTTYEYIRSSKSRITKSPPAVPDLIVITSDTDGCLNLTSDDDDEPDTFFTAPPVVPDTDKEEDDREKLKLTLRSNKTTQDIVLVVRPTTTCGAIVRAFLRKAGLADLYPMVMSGGTSSTTKKRGMLAKDPRIYVEGDKMGNEVEIGDADVEDGDMVEVGGL